MAMVITAAWMGLAMEAHGITWLPGRLPLGMAMVDGLPLGMAMVAGLSAVIILLGAQRHSVKRHDRRE
jgi:hypothetical protein